MMKLPSFHLPGPHALAFSALLGATAVLLAPPLVPTSRAANLVVDASFGNSPYSFASGTSGYGNVYVGLNTTGVLNQTGGVLNVSGQLFLGYYNGSAGVYNLSAGTLNTISADVGYSDTGVFTLSGTGIDNVTGTDGTANGSLSLAVNTGSTGTFNLNGGTLTAGYVRGGSGTSTFNFNGGTLTAGASATDFLQNFTHAYVQAGGATINTNGYNVAVAQALASGTASGTTDGGLLKLGAGTLTLSGASTYTGDTGVSAGTLAVGSGGSVTGGNIYVGTGATLAIAGTGSVRPGGSYELDVEGTTASPASVTLSGTGNLSTGQVTIGGDDGTTGTFTQSGGTFTINNGNALYLGSKSGSSGSYTLSGTGSLSAGEALIGYGGTGLFTQSGGTFTINGYGFFLGGNSGGSGSYNLSGSGSLSTGDAHVGYDGTGLFTQSGGTFTTNGHTLFLGYDTGSSGTYNLSGGTLNVGAVTSGNPGTSGTSTFNFNGGTLQASASNTSFFGGLTTANVQAGGAKVDTNGFNVTVAQNLLHDTTGGAAATDGGLTKLGAGTLTLTGANTYTGNTTVSAGTLILNVGSTASRLFQANPGGQIQYNGGFVVGGNLAGSGTQSVLGGGATFSSPTAGVLTIFNGATLNVGGPTDFEEVNNSGTVAVASGQTLTWNNGQNNLGTLTVSGTANTSGWASTGVITVNNGGTLANGGSNLVLGGGSRTTVNAGGTLSTASGTTVELDGALLTNNGTLRGTVNVNYGSTLKGSGSAGSVNVTDGGRFGVNAPSTGMTVNSGLSVVHLTSPGGLASTAFVGPQLSAAPGTATLTSLALGSGSVFAFSVQDARGTAGSGYDLVHATGALTLSAGTAAGSLITVSLASLGSDGTSGMAANFDPTRSYGFVLVTADGGIAGYNPGEFTVDVSGFKNATNGGSFSVVEQGNQLLLEYNAVPEPSTWALLGVGVAALGVAALRQRRALTVRRA